MNAATAHRAFARAEAHLLGTRHPGPRSTSEAETQAAVKALRAGAYGPAFQTTNSPTINEAYEQLHQVTEDLASVLGVVKPEFERFFAAGLSEAPDLTDRGTGLVPVLAPHGVGLHAWLRISEASRGALLPRVELSPEALRWGAALDQPAAMLRLPIRAAGSRPQPVVWTLRWVPAGDGPDDRGEPYRTAAHVTLPEMLVLQAVRARLGLSLVDTASFTWLQGDLPEPGLAARHTFDVRSSTIRISTRTRTDRGQHVGARLAQEPYAKNNH